MSSVSPNRRHSVSSSAGATVRCAGGSDDLPVRMLDFSSTGAGFLMPELPEIGTTIVLSITDNDEALQLSGTVRWAQTRPGGWWRVGCHFDEPLSEGLDLEEKRVIRDNCAIPVVMRCEGEGDDRHEGTIINHSEGGLCIRTRSRFATGDALMFETTGGLERTRFVARVQWLREEGTENVLGCQFTRPSGLRAFRRLLEDPLPRRVDDPVREANNGAVWVGCFLTVALAAVYTLELWPL